MSNEIKINKKLRWHDKLSTVSYGALVLFITLWPLMLAFAVVFMGLGILIGIAI